MGRKNIVTQQKISSIDSWGKDKLEKSKTSEENSTRNNASVTSGGELSHMRGAKIYSVGEISKMVKEYLESNDTLNKIWIRGEISNFTLHRSGHMYFDLKDDESVVSCVMFRSANQNLKFEPKHGMKVLAFGNISVYIPHGKYQFILFDLLPDGLGALHLAYLQLKEKLSKEGLFALEHKKPIPRIPKVIGIITSPTGAAIKDIIRVATRRFPGIQIIISPSKVQGGDAADQLILALKRLHQIGGVDVIIMGRGGGSLEDLWAFNEEPVARAIFESKIPIISAVGHETDYTISDFVADERASTPSAAAERVVPDTAELLQEISFNIQQIKQVVENEIRIYRQHLNRLLESPVFTRPMDKINIQKQNLDNIFNLFSNNMVNYFNLKRSNLDQYIGKLTVLNPKSILDRGYSMTLKLPEEHLITSVKAVSKRDLLKIIFKDGSVKVEVDERSELEDGEQ